MLCRPAVRKTTRGDRGLGSGPWFFLLRGFWTPSPQRQVALRAVKAEAPVGLSEAEPGGGGRRRLGARSLQSELGATASASLALPNRLRK